MAAQSRMTELGSRAPDFVLTDATGGVWSLDKIAGGKPVLVAFICNHCPYVVHIAPAFAAFAREYGDKGLAICAISANDIATHPQDGPDRMAEFARRYCPRVLVLAEGALVYDGPPSGHTLAAATEAAPVATGVSA